jgi:hypothetical protein
MSNHHPATVKGTMSAGKHKKRVGLFGIFGSNKVRNDTSYQLVFILYVNLDFFKEYSSYSKNFWI